MMGTGLPETINPRGYTMTLTIGSLRITIFKFERIERYTELKIDREQTKREADAIKNSESFQNIKARAAQIRANRR